MAKPKPKSVSLELTGDAQFTPWIDVTNQDFIVKTKGTFEGDIVLQYFDEDANAWCPTGDVITEEGVYAGVNPVRLRYRAGFDGVYTSGSVTVTIEADTSGATEV